jgi:putative ABC transport system ATP-binding protein
MLELRDVTKTYEARETALVMAVRSVSLEVKRGEFIVISGRSGSGKSTLLNMMAGLTRPTSGQVLLDGVEVWKRPDGEQSRLRSQKIGFIFQFPSLLPSLTVHENVSLPVGFAGASGDAERRKSALDLLETVGLTDKLSAYPRQLSAGQQQRVVIARALVNRPELLLADEATSNLDEQTEREIMDLLVTIRARTGVTILLVSHASELVRYCSRSLTMVAGALVS